MKRGFLILTAALFLLLVLNCCSVTDVTKGERTEIEYTVVKTNEIPSEVGEIINERKEEEFQMTYESGGYLYLLRGYGKQKSGGYSIRVEEVSVSDEALHVRTTLLGPPDREAQKGAVSCPYIVLKTEERSNLPVVFED
ncbi:MAG: protease complex subunit PrcB family protein [Fusicatenibacter sp.]|nr:protease complex subunit PrcB family protein [Fusicatenibacter sp.]MDY2937176.1 protease complex subunit PrcB family protein [Fusicatenibacter sp.]